MENPALPPLVLQQRLVESDLPGTAVTPISPDMTVNFVWRFGLMPLAVNETAPPAVSSIREALPAGPTRREFELTCQRSRPRHVPADLLDDPEADDGTAQSRYDSHTPDASNDPEGGTHAA